MTWFLFSCAYTAGPLKCVRLGRALLREGGTCVMYVSLWPSNVNPKPKFYSRRLPNPLGVTEYTPWNYAYPPTDDIYAVDGTYERKGGSLIFTFRGYRHRWEEAGSGRFAFRGFQGISDAYGNGFLADVAVPPRPMDVLDFKRTAPGSPYCKYAGELRTTSQKTPGGPVAWVDKAVGLNIDLSGEYAPYLKPSPPPGGSPWDELYLHGVSSINGMDAFSFVLLSPNKGPGGSEPSKKGSFDWGTLLFNGGHDFRGHKVLDTYGHQYIGLAVWEQGIKAIVFAGADYQTQENPTKWTIPLMQSGYYLSEPP